MKFEEKRFLIIIGQPKAGTTSLFSWLASHPDICPSTFKEARFFLDADYPLPRPLRFNGNNISDYARLFPCKDKSVLLEATPDYLYNETPLRMADLLPNAKVIVIVREPIQRMMSAYRYFQQRGAVPTSMTFEAYISIQINLVVSPSTPVHFRALDHCRLGKYLPAFEAAFGERCLVINFDELKHNAYEVMQKVCRFVGINDKHFNDFVFAVENETGEPRISMLSKSFHNTRTRMAHIFVNSPQIRKMLRPISAFIQRVLFRKRSSSQVLVSDQVRARITTYLETDNMALGVPHVKVANTTKNR